MLLNFRYDPRTTLIVTNFIENIIFEKAGGKVENLKFYKNTILIQ